MYTYSKLVNIWQNYMKMQAHLNVYNNVNYIPNISFNKQGFFLLLCGSGTLLAGFVVVANIGMYGDRGEYEECKRKAGEVLPPGVTLLVFTGLTATSFPDEF